MSHPARKYVSVDLSLTLAEAEALHAALEASRSPSAAASSIRECLASQLRRLEWTRYSDTPENAPRLARLLRRAASPTIAASG